MKRGAGKKNSKVAKGSKERIAILESNDEEIDKLCRDFEVNDSDDIEDILSGRIGEIAVEW